MAQANPTGEQALGGDLEETFERGREKLEQARGRVENLYQRARDRATDFGGEVEDYVTTHPMRSVLTAAGIGAGLGILVSLLLARR
jgi:ElaB/YqjD/DUF883 family membrane-anchored ribosome-binding protein